MIHPEDLGGLPPADALIAHTPTGTVHAVRPSAPVWVISVPAELLERPAVRLARQAVDLSGGIGTTPWRVSDQHVHALVDALASDDTTTLVELATGLLDTTEKKENHE